MKYNIAKFFIITIATSCSSSHREPSQVPPELDSAVSANKTLASSPAALSVHLKLAAAAVLPSNLEPKLVGIIVEAGSDGHNTFPFGQLDYLQANGRTKYLDTSNGISCNPNLPVTIITKATINDGNGKTIVIGKAAEVTNCRANTAAYIDLTVTPGTEEALLTLKTLTSFH